MIFDTHAHYDDEQFREDLPELMEQMNRDGVGRILNVSATLDSCDKVLAMTKRWPMLYGAVGVHPDECGSLNETAIGHIRDLCREEKIVAIGEIGLDYHWMVQPKDIQKKWFARQMELAKELDMPVNIHSRDAAEDTFSMVREHADGLCGIIHCFSGSPEMAEEYVKLGFYIGIGGVVTFKNGKRLKQVVEKIPPDRIVLETDAPYLAPEPFRGRRNDSSKLTYVAAQIAQIKGLSEEEVAAVTCENGKRVYGIG